MKITAKKFIVSYISKNEWSENENAPKDIAHIQQTVVWDKFLKRNFEKEFNAFVIRVDKETVKVEIPVTAQNVHLLG